MGKRESHDQGSEPRSKEVHTTPSETMARDVRYSITIIGYGWAKNPYTHRKLGGFPRASTVPIRVKA